MSLTTGKQAKLSVEESPAPSGGESGWLERGDHPLLNDLILDTLFGFVRRCDLKDCRIVSKKWTLRTILHMRATFRVTIEGSQSKTNRNDRQIEDFVKLFSSNELGCPFESFKLGPFRTTDGVGQQFLQLCGETAKEIDLYGPYPHTYRIEDVSQLLRSSPNLKVLGFTSRLSSSSGTIVKLFPDSIPTFPSLKSITFHSDNDKPRKCCPSAIDELLSAALYISDIIVSDIHNILVGWGIEADRIEDVTEINAVLNCIEKLGRESSIQSLSLVNARFQHIEHLRRMAEKENGLKLKSLTFYPSSVPDENFDTAQIQLAGMFKDTIQYLTVDLGYRSFPETDLMGFPYMPYLKSLTFLLQRTAPLPVNLTHNFPALERLKILLPSDFYYYSDFFPQFVPSPTIKSLSVPGRHINIQTFRNILRMFPNLTKLHFSVQSDGSEILRKMWSQMPGLESLTIYIHGTQKEHLDSVFTGIPTPRLNEIHPVVNELGKMTVEERRHKILELTEQHSRFPSIRNLTKLRHLDLRVDGEDNWKRDETHPSDITAYLAFYSMCHLRHLDVKGCTFTKTCCEILTKETGIENWCFFPSNRRLSNEYNIIPPFLLREQNNHYN